MAVVESRRKGNAIAPHRCRKRVPEGSREDLAKTHAALRTRNMMMYCTTSSFSTVPYTIFRRTWHKSLQPVQDGVQRPAGRIISSGLFLALVLESRIEHNSCFGPSKQPDFPLDPTRSPRRMRLSGKPRSESSSFTIKSWIRAPAVAPK